MDDTIENLGSAWVDLLNKRHGTSVVWEDVHYWDFTKVFPELTEEQIYSPLREAELWDNVTPKEDAVFFLEKLIQDGHDVYIVTASLPDSVHLKMTRVLYKYFPYIDTRKIIIAYNKQMIKGDVLVDDAIHNLIGGDFEKILISSPNNITTDETQYGITRAENWEEIYDIICRLDERHRCIGVRAPRM